VTASQGAAAPDRRFRTRPAVIAKTVQAAQISRLCHRTRAQLAARCHPAAKVRQNLSPCRAGGASWLCFLRDLAIRGGYALVCGAGAESGTVSWPLRMMAVRRALRATEESWVTITSVRPRSRHRFPGAS
jgi:hypothetical protein